MAYIRRVCVSTEAWVRTIRPVQKCSWLPMLALNCTTGALKASAMKPIGRFSSAIWVSVSGKRISTVSVENTRPRDVPAVTYWPIPTFFARTRPRKGTLISVRATFSLASFRSASAASNSASTSMTCGLFKAYGVGSPAVRLSSQCSVLILAFASSRCTATCAPATRASARMTASL